MSVLLRYNYPQGDLSILEWLLEIARQEKILVRTYPFLGRIKERYIRSPDGIALLTIRTGLNEEEAALAIAHGLGHHFLHRANCWHCPEDELQRMEDEADLFARLLLMPPEAFHIPTQVTAATYIVNQLATDQIASLQYAATAGNG